MPSTPASTSQGAVPRRRFIRLEACIRETPCRTVTRSGRAQLGRRVQEGLVGLDLRQRLDAPARLLLRVLDEARQLIVRARARRERGVAGARKSQAQQAETGLV